MTHWQNDLSKFIKHIIQFSAERIDLDQAWLARPPLRDGPGAANADIEYLTVNAKMEFAAWVHLVNMFIGNLPFCAAPFDALAKIKSRGFGHA